MRTFLVALVCLAAVLGASQPAQAQSCTGDSGCLYQRPAQRPALPLDHPRLARSSSAGSRTPEQVHLAFAGPGAYAVSWATHPLDGLRLEGEGEAAAAAGGLGAASRRLAAAGAALEQQQQPHVGSAAAGDEEEADASEQLGRRHHRRHRRKHRTCEAVRKAAGRSVVQYGTEPGEYPHTVESHEEVGCYSSGRYLSGALHRVILGAGLEGPLPPNTTIYYRCGDPSWDEEGGDASGSGDSGWSEEFSFRTAPLTGAPGALPYRLGLIGDLGQSEHSVSTLDHLDFNAPDSIILTGDLSYADGYQPRWDTWQRLVAPHTSRQVWMYTVGNHEIELTNGVKGFVSYESRFYFPYRQSLSESKLYYSYDVAGAHVIMLSSYSDYARASEQYAWLLRDLAAVDRSRTPWLLVVMHAPWYNSNYAHQGEGDAMQESMEALLYEHGVDMIFSGHVHAYERHHRVFQGKLDRCAPIHINIGDGGNKEGPDMKYFPQPKYSAFREPSFGHGTLDLMDATHAEWRWHRNQDDGPDIADSLSIVRDPDCKGHARSSSGSGGGSSGGASAAAAAATAADAPQQEAQQEAQQQQQHHHHSHRCFWRRLRRWAAHTAGLLGWPA